MDKCTNHSQKQMLVKINHCTCRHSFELKINDVRLFCMIICVASRRILIVQFRLLDICTRNTAFVDSFLLCMELRFHNCGYLMESDGSIIDFATHV